jgi:hypothetical protein
MSGSPTSSDVDASFWRLEVGAAATCVISRRRFAKLRHDCAGTGTLCSDHQRGRAIVFEISQRAIGTSPPTPQWPWVTV